MRKIKTIVIHCADTPRGRNIDISEVRKWHTHPKKMKKDRYRYLGKTYDKKEDLPSSVREKTGNGWNDIGYHFFIKLDGTIQIGRELNTPGAHVKGHNKDSIGICYAGGGGEEDTRTNAQMVSLVYLVGVMKRINKGAKVWGHKDFLGVRKSCPCFDASHEYKHI